MTYILHEVLQAVKSWFITAPLGNTQPSPYLDAIVRLKNSVVPDNGVYGSIERIYSLTATVDEYIDLLERAIESIKGGNVFTFGGPELTPTEVPLRKWYLDKKGGYLDPEERFTRFVEKACEFLELFEVVEINPPTSVVMERSRERLLVLVNNLIDISNR